MSDVVLLNGWLHRYSLFAVVNHSGSLHNGHYTCYIRPQQDQVREREKENTQRETIVFYSGINVMIIGSLGLFQSRFYPVKGKLCICVIFMFLFFSLSKVICCFITRRC